MINSLIILIIFILIIIYLFPRYISGDNDKYYLIKNSVFKTHTLSENEIADIFDSLSEKTDKLIYYLDKNYSNNNYAYKMPFYSNVKLLLKRYSPNMIGENILPFGTSYTINKGSYIGLCLENKDINTLFFVLLHELAHVGTKSVGHTQEFLEFFRFLLKLAIQLDIYTYVDYSKTPATHCSLKIDKQII